MELAQIDLSKIKAIGHDGEQLGILLDRGEGVLEFLTTPAPRQALFGIQQLALMAAGKKVTAPTNDEVQIKMLDVASSNIKAIGYSAFARVLQVDFLSGSRYRYLAVEPEIFKRFIDAASKGQFLNREIKRVYQYCRID